MVARSYDLLAQSVEHVTFNHGVQGSIPWQITKNLSNKRGFFLYIKIYYIN